MIVYVIIMYRWGDENSHSYFEGVGSDKEIALNRAQRAEKHKDNKYEAEIIEVEVGSQIAKRYIKEIFSKQSGENNRLSHENPEKSYKNKKQ